MRSLARLTRSLKKAYSSLLNEQNEKKHVVTCDKGLICDIIDESFYKPIIVASTKPSCRTSTSTSSSSDSFICDASLIVENETLKEVKELNHTLAKAMVVRTACLCAWVAKGHLSTKGD
jgi:hypothetical protein